MNVRGLVESLQTMNQDYEIHPEMTVNFLMIMIEGLKLSDRDKHVLRHKRLHECLDELIADMMLHTQHLPSKTSIMQLMEWDYSQAKNPTETT